MQFFGIDDKTEELKEPPKTEPPKEKSAAEKEKEELADIEEHILRILPEEETKI